MKASEYIQILQRLHRKNHKNNSDITRPRSGVLDCENGNL
jgi:hypothetical protein